MNDQFALMLYVIVSIAALLLMTLQALKSERGNLASWLFVLVLILSFANTVRLLTEMRELNLLMVYCLLILTGIVNIMLWHPEPLRVTPKTTTPKSDDTQASA